MRQARAGFTLIELLVVIAIIAILAAILFPVFARARAKAQQNNCLSNVKQITLAHIMYCSDYDQKFVLCSYPADWSLLLAPYIKNTQIFVCGSDRSNERCSGDSNTFSYGANGMMGSPVYGYGATVNPQSMEEVDFPAEMIAFGDALSVAPTHIFDLNAAACMDVCLPTVRDRSPMDRHNEGVNLGFVDGHAKWAGLKAIPDSEDGRCNGGTVPRATWCAWWFGRSDI